MLTALLFAKIITHTYYIYEVYLLYLFIHETMKSPSAHRTVIATAVFIVLGLFFGITTQLPDKNLHIVFCDVGQGDAVYIRTPDNKDILVDGGKSGQNVVRCLSDHMPFWDRTIDVVAVTHPQFDHYGGIQNVLERYSVSYFVIPPVDNPTAKSFAALKNAIKQRGIAVVNTYTGDRLRMGAVQIDTLWPDRTWLAGKIQESRIKNTESGIRDEIVEVSTNVLGAYETKQDLNDFSIYFHIQMGEFDALLTGDGDVRIQDDVMARVTVPDVEVFKVPHHGSKTGMTQEFVDAVRPELSVISVGKNSYGHPAKSILTMLSDAHSRVLRTDEVGDIEVVSNGTNWWVNSEE